MKKQFFRPVTVLPALNNIYERLLLSQMLHHFQGLLSDYLSAYRRFYSCDTTVLRLVEDWKECLDRGELVAVVAMDLSKAFDSLPQALLIAKLRAYGLDEQCCSLLEDYFQDRQQRVKVGDVFSTWEHNQRGVPQGSVLGPLLFNIFLNDLFYFITKVKLNAYADDQQLHSSDTDHLALYNRMNSELSVAANWFRQNGLMANPSKFQTLILGETDLDFTFTVDAAKIEKCDDIDLLGINLDSRLSFKKHTSHICEKVNNQIRVIGRFRKLLSGSIKVRLYKAFLQPIFQYCSIVWHFCGARNSDKLELVNKQALRLVLGDTSSSYSVLLRKLNMVSLKDKRIQNMLTMVYKGLCNMAPGYITSLFHERTHSTYNLRGQRKLQIPAVRTTTFGLHSFKYLAVSAWNSLSDAVRTSDTLSTFKRGIRNYVLA